ncbi:MAG TPA: hypothetical protein VNN74_09670 [Candidatus Micrarchaeia archaeon]|nr:hypothetical protein [Candidatus Micrarchaeia archaeon]
MRSSAPYHFGSPVGPEHFADREPELALLAGRMIGGISVIVHAPRRFGKTSLVRRGLLAAEAAGAGVGYANLLRCSTRREAAQTVVRAIFAGPLHRRDLLRRLGGLLERIRVRPTVEVATDGRVQLGFDPALADRDWGGAMGDACRILAEEAGRRPVALALDEFQQVAEIDAGLAGVFKAMLDEAPSVSFVLAGSHLHLMERLTTLPGAPLLGMGELLRLGPIPEPAMTAYLVRQSRRAGRPMDEAAARLVSALAGPVPNDVQRLAQSAFDTADAVIDAGCVERGMELAVSRQSATFAERYERLSGTAQRLLRLLAEGPVARPYARAVMTGLEVANDNAVRKALAALTFAELAVRTGGAWHVADPFLRRWLVSGAD